MAVSPDGLAYATGATHTPHTYDRTMLAWASSHSPPTITIWSCVIVSDMGSPLLLLPTSCLSSSGSFDGYVRLHFFQDDYLFQPEEVPENY